MGAKLIYRKGDLILLKKSDNVPFNLSGALVRLKSNYEHEKWIIQKIKFLKKFTLGEHYLINEKWFNPSFKIQQNEF